jgi:uncharacterized ion transporter superfamily protein YfcC
LGIPCNIFLFLTLAKQGFLFPPILCYTHFLPNFPKPYLNLHYGQKKKIPKFSQFFGEEDNKKFQEKKNKTLLLSSLHGTFLILTVAKQGFFFPKFCDIICFFAKIFKNIIRI